MLEVDTRVKIDLKVYTLFTLIVRNYELSLLL